MSIFTVKLHNYIIDFEAEQEIESAETWKRLVSGVLTALEANDN